MALHSDRYFDAAAGIQLHPAALQAVEAASVDGWADPARLSGAGRRSAILLEAARGSAAEMLGVRPTEISFVPSGAHALESAVLGCLAGRSRAGRTLLHSAVEHSSVLRAAQWHEAAGGRVCVGEVDSFGRVLTSDFLGLAREPDVAVAVLQAANHEVGTRQPIAEISAGLAGTGVPLIVDASQDVLYGDLPSEVPVLTLDPRLWGGPAGVGVLIIRGGTRWRTPFPADESEYGRGLGVPNVPAIVGAVAALRAQRVDREVTALRLAGLIDLIRREVVRVVPDAQVLGDPVNRLPHLVTFSLLYASGETLLHELDRHGFAVSSGSSCTADTLTPSHVLVAMKALTSGNIRVSLPATATERAVTDFLELLPELVRSVREQQPGARSVEPCPAEPVSRGNRIIDSRGRLCPLPILDLARALPGVSVGAEVTVLADDPAAASDIAAWCRMRDQELIAVTSQPLGAQAYRVRRLR